MSPKRIQSYFHLHLISDATGETLTTVGRAAAARYFSVRPIEHAYPLVRTTRRLDAVLRRVEQHPGIVLYTMVDRELSEYLEKRCVELACPVVSILDPVLRTFQNYLGAKETPKVAAQHVLDANYFRRIDALNFTLMHDDGQLPEDVDAADVILVGISRTSKTPTSIYLANRGLKTANVPMVPSIPLPPSLEAAEKPLIVGLIASAERIRQVREHRLQSLNAPDNPVYVDRLAIADEIRTSKQIFKRNGWPAIDVTRRSIEETAAEVIALYNERKRAADAFFDPY